MTKEYKEKVELTTFELDMIVEGLGKLIDGWSPKDEYDIPELAALKARLEDVMQDLDDRIAEDEDPENW